MIKLTTGMIEKKQRDILEGAVPKFVAEIQGNLKHNEDLEPAVIRFIQDLRRELEALHSA
jgi:hypothetical protein